MAAIYGFEGEELNRQDAKIAKEEERERKERAELRQRIEQRKTQGSE
jgi:hypothetical protein